MSDPKARALTPRQQAFVEYYAECGDAGEAAKQAGYAARYAGENASKLLKNTNVQAALAALTAQVSSKRIADAQERQEFWTEMMRDASQETKDRLKADENRESFTDTLIRENKELLKENKDLRAELREERRKKQGSNSDSNSERSP